MWQGYIQPLAVAAIITFGLTFSVKTIAERLRVLDIPAPRKIHTKPIPRLGGVAIVLAFLLVTIAYSFASPRFHFGLEKLLIFDQKMVGVWAGALILLIVGIIDDIRGVKPLSKLFWHIVAASLVVCFGLNISYIRLPFGEHLELTGTILTYSLWGLKIQFVLWANLVTIFWIVLLINTMNFLDGLDGLAGGVSAIAGLVIFFLSLSLGQTASALLAIIFSGCVLGFIPWNFNPAKIFMGDSGSMFLGFMLGVLSVISGGKVATAFLVLGIPVLDVGWVAFRRLMSGQSPFQADKYHLHHRLITAGLTQRQAVIMLYLVSAIFGVVAIFSQTEGKVYAFMWLLLVMGALAITLIVLEYIKKAKK